MMGLSKLFRRHRPEVRESYTDQVVARMLAASTGVGDGGALAAIETAARWWGLGLASATVKPSNLALASITPSVLDTVGRALCRSGESLHVIDVRNGRVTLTPTASCRFMAATTRRVGDTPLPFAARIRRARSRGPPIASFTSFTRLTRPDRGPGARP